MNSKSTIIVLVAALAVLSGAMGMSMTGAFSDQEFMTASTKNVAIGLMAGHLEVEARNADGELFAYRQTDNEVVDDGEQCILKLLFATTGNVQAGRGEYTSVNAAAGNPACTGALTGAWDVIGIGTTTTSAADTDVRLGNETSTSNGLHKGTATTKTWSNGTGTDATQIVLSKTFTNESPRAHAIAESGLFNSTTLCNSTTGVGCQGMLAHKAFSAVTLANGDSITITWTFRVGN